MYPNGGAATNRHLAYAKGLRELGHEIIFILIKKQEWEEESLTINQINLVCVSPSCLKTDSKIKKLRCLFKAIYNAKEKISNEHKASKISAIILLDTDILILMPLLKQAKALGVKVFHERTEYPFVVSGKTIIDKIKLTLYLEFVINKFTGIFVINNALKKYFIEKTNGRVPIKIINMIVDPSRFICPSKPSNSHTLITYCGTLEGDKDGVPILLESFAKIAEEFPLLRLQLIGSLNDKSTRLKVESLIKTLSLKNRVILFGSVNRDKIPELLCNSDILVLARPSNKQAEGGFPTKLGEYLATGNVVLITDVGEISLFLKDKKNAFISEPNSAEKFSQKLREALLNENRAQIGLEGKKLVFNEFNYLTQARAIEEMLIETEKDVEWKRSV
jgi:glycosyltransferase involved in cell wall biosynthesis